MKKMRWSIKGLMICFYAICFILLKHNSVEANQIYEASEFPIGNTVTNDDPEYMNYYKLSISERKTIEVTCIGYSSAQDIYRLYLYNSDFEEIDCNDPYGLTIENGARKETKRFTFDPGTYYIAVQDNDTNMIKYELTIDNVNTSTLWNYYGNSFSNATQLYMGDQLSGFLRGAYYENAEQYYKINLDEKTLLSLNFTYAQGSEITIALFDSAYNNIGDYDVKSDDVSSKKIEKTLGAGTYYVKAYYGYNTNDGVDYGFSVNRKCITPTIKSYRGGSKKLSGTATPNSQITIKVNKKVYSVTANSKGVFSVKLKSKLKKNDKITLVSNRSGYLKSSKKVYKVN